MIEATPFSEIEHIKKTHTFRYEGKEADLYFCKCGNKIEKNKSSGEEINVKVYDGDDFDISDISEMETMASNIVCDKCYSDYSRKENYNFVIPVDKNFIERYDYTENEKSIVLCKNMYKGVLDTNKETISVVGMESRISLDKVTKKIYFKSYDASEDAELTLDKIMPVMKVFYNHNGVATTDGLFEVHKFLNRLTNFVSDSKNMNIISELMSQMIGKAGIDVMIKINSIFFGIICYPNLSTIALTKGTIFLYDMMDNCNLPNSSVLSDNNVTSPIKIFNFLVNIKNEELKKELDSHDHEKAGYVFKSKTGEEHTIRYNLDKLDIVSGNVKVGKTGVFVRDDVSQKSVSSFIFKKIKKFSEYATLIRYTRFVSYSDLINLVMKYETDFLINLLDTVEFRNGINMSKLSQVLEIATSFLIRYKKITENTEYGSEPRFLRNKFKKSSLNFEHRTEDEQKIAQENIVVDYSILKHFDLAVYDDCLRMISDLKWDPNKEFYKIKNISELETYHDQLAEHFNLLSDKQKNRSFVDFVEKFKFLEDQNDKLKIRLIKTPDALLDASKAMKNCAGSYVTRISSGQYILFIVEDLDADKNTSDPLKYMLGIRVNKHKLEFDQVKAACNIQGPDRFKKQIMKYLEDKDISYKELADIKLKEVREN